MRNEWEYETIYQIMNMQEEQGAEEKRQSPDNKEKSYQAEQNKTHSAVDATPKGFHQNMDVENRTGKYPCLQEFIPLNRKIIQQI